MSVNSVNNYLFTNPKYLNQVKTPDQTKQVNEQEVCQSEEQKKSSKKKKIIVTAAILASLVAIVAYVATKGKAKVNNVPEKVLSDGSVTDKITQTLAEKINPKDMEYVKDFERKVVNLANGKTKVIYEKPLTELQNGSSFSFIFDKNGKLVERLNMELSKDGKAYKYFNVAKNPTANDFDLFMSSSLFNPDKSYLRQNNPFQKSAKIKVKDKSSVEKSFNRLITYYDEALKQPKVADKYFIGGSKSHMYAYNANNELEGMAEVADGVSSKLLLKGKKPQVVEDISKNPLFSRFVKGFTNA